MSVSILIRRTWRWMGLISGSAAVLGAAEIRVIGGTGVRGFSGDGGLAIQAQFNEVSGLARGPDGALYLCDTGNDRIRRIGRDGLVTTIAGTGVKGYSGDGGPAVKAQLNEPWEIKFDADGNAFWVERLNAVVRELEQSSGRIRTVAGTGKPGFSGDGGKATAAMLGEPHSFDFDANGLMWLVLRDGNAVVTLDLAQGAIHRVAGTGQKGLTGDNGPAAAATFNGPKGISVAGDDVFLADTENHCIRRMDAKGAKIVRVAGTGKKGDGPYADPLAAALTRPHGVLANDDGSFWIGDTDGNRVLYVTP